MADNLVLNAGAGGATIRTDDIGGVMHPSSKMTLGVDGSDDGFVHALNPMPVANWATLIDVTLALDTSAYADGDVLADRQVVSNALRVNDGTGFLVSVEVIDVNGVGVGLDLVFLSADVFFGTVNSAPGISAADSVNILGSVSISASDLTNWSGPSTASVRGIALMLKTVSGTRDIYVAAVTRGGAPTYAADGLVLRLGILGN